MKETIKVTLKDWLDSIPVMVALFVYFLCCGLGFGVGFVFILKICGF